MTALRVQTRKRSWRATGGNGDRRGGCLLVTIGGGRLDGARAVVGAAQSELGTQAPDHDFVPAPREVLCQQKARQGRLAIGRDVTTLGDHGARERANGRRIHAWVCA